MTQVITRNQQLRGFDFQSIIPDSLKSQVDSKSIEKMAKEKGLNPDQLKKQAEDLVKNDGNTAPTNTSTNEQMLRYGAPFVVGASGGVGYFMLAKKSKKRKGHVFRSVLVGGSLGLATAGVTNYVVKY